MSGYATQCTNSREVVLARERVAMPGSRGLLSVLASTSPITRQTRTLRPEREVDAVLWRHMAGISVAFPFLIPVTYGLASTRQW